MKAAKRRNLDDGAHVLTWNYDGDGPPTSVTEGSRTWKTSSYAAKNANQGMMRQASSSLGPEADFNYHTNLQLKEVLYSNGVTGTYQRDPDSLVRPYRRTFTGPEGTLYDTGFFDYDGAGNTRTALKLPDGRPEYQWTWDAFNMQTEAKRNLEGGGSERWVYVYGPGDYRLRTEDYTGDEVVFDWEFRGPNGQILQEYEVRRDGDVWNHVRDVIHGAEGPMAARYADGSERYFHTDHLGTPRVITKADGSKLSEHHYYPYGLEVPIEVESPVPEGFIFADDFESGDTSRWATQNHPQPPPEGPPPEELSIKYTGHERDLHRSTDYMLARSYAFLLGRFLSVDRVQDGWNRYGYAHSNPVSWIDPTGRTQRKGWAAGTVANNSNRTVYIAGDVGGDRPKVFALNPGETSTEYLEDTDAVILSRGGARTYKIGTSDVSVKTACRFGSCNNVVLLSVDVEYIINFLVGRARQLSPEEAEVMGWVAPSPDDASEQEATTEESRETESRQQDQSEEDTLCSERQDSGGSRCNS